MTIKRSKTDLARDAKRSNQIVCPHPHPDGPLQPALVVCCHVVSGKAPAHFYIAGEPGRAGELLCAQKHSFHDLSLFCQQCAAERAMLPAPTSTAV